ncbi:hypothetical protein EDD86DRAFT_209231 [Gorgonomyces haynaldii]|nr:hypothetical protein EDD86DRAFT_209231 [Gorgonomyces haynaldii]
MDPSVLKKPCDKCKAAGLICDEVRPVCTHCFETGQPCFYLVKEMTMKPTGCTRCLTRKLKCDNERPLCGGCFKAKQACVYQAVKEEVDSMKPKSIVFDMALMPDIKKPTEKKMLDLSMLSDVTAKRERTPKYMDPLGDLSGSHMDWIPVQMNPVMPPAIASRQSIDKIPSSTRTSVLQFMSKYVSTDRAPYLPEQFVVQEAERSPLVSNALCAAISSIRSGRLIKEYDNLELGNHFYDLAVKDLSNILHQREIMNIFALAMLFMHSREKNDVNACLNYRAAIVAHGKELGLFSRPSTALSPEQHIQSAIRINLFWYIHIVDCSTALLLDAPPLIKSQDISVPLPVCKDEFDLQNYTRRVPHLGLETGIMSSTHGYVPVPPFINPTGALMILEKILLLTSEYAQRRRQSNGPSPELDYLEKALDVSLKGFAQDTAHLFFSNIPFSKETWWLYYCRVPFYTSLMMLHLAKLGKSEIYFEQSIEKSPVFTEGVIAAQQITEIIGFFHDNGMIESTGYTGYLSQALLYSSMVHDLIVQLQPNTVMGWQSMDNMKRNLQFAEKLRKFGTPCTQIYQRLALKNQMGSNMIEPSDPQHTIRQLFTFYQKS